MTANERAATFIGWEPFREVSECRCRERPNFHPLVKVPVKCPNMALSANYMKALENEICELTHDLEGWHLYLEKLEVPEGFIPVVCWHKTAGEAVIAALAQLYDAQHGGEPR